jgi:hypothetical protein
MYGRRGGVGLEASMVGLAGWLEEGGGRGGCGWPPAAAAGEENKQQQAQAASATSGTRQPARQASHCTAAQQRAGLSRSSHQQPAAVHSPIIRSVHTPCWHTHADPHPTWSVTCWLVDAVEGDTQRLRALGGTLVDALDGSPGSCNAQQHQQHCSRVSG